MWIEVANLCDRLGCLPEEGALFDQNPKYLRRMEAVFQAQHMKEQDDIEAERNRKN